MAEKGLLHDNPVSLMRVQCLPLALLLETSVAAVQRFLGENCASQLLMPTISIEGHTIQHLQVCHDHRRLSYGDLQHSLTTV